MEIITNKNEMYERIKDWETIKINCTYELGSNELIAEYEGMKVKYVNDDKLNVGYYASQLNGITAEEYEQLFNDIENSK